MLISIAVPVFRNEGSLSLLYERIVQTIAQIPGTEYEIVFVDDGSDDGSLEVLMDISESDPNVTVIKLSRNFGQHAANNAAFQHVNGDIIINMSADLQDPPEIITEIVKKISLGSDIVLATRKSVKESAIKKITSWLHYKLIRLSVPSYPQKGFDFWGANRKAFNAFMSFNDVVRRNQTDLLSIGFKVDEIPYEKNQRIHGTSQYNFFRRLDISLNQILATAVWPLRMTSVFGLFFTSIGFLYAVYLFFAYFRRDYVIDGWTPIMMLILIIGGIIMAMLGVIGEYLWRIYFETKQRPLFFIDQVYKSKKNRENNVQKG